jgi:hypothetical protein
MGGYDLVLPALIVLIMVGLSLYLIAHRLSHKSNRKE